MKRRHHHEHSESETRHATNLELFLDLVFVFAITQLTGFLADHHDLAGLGNTLLLTMMAWWQWTAFTWTGSQMDLQRSALARVVVLALIGPTLLMAILIPDALGDSGHWFGLSYFVVMVVVTSVQSIEALAHEETRSAFLRYAPLALSMPAVVAVGGFFPPEIRVWIWTLAIVGSLGGALMQNGAEGEWRIDPVHFAERHALFVIICLGEGLVATGAKAYAHLQYGTFDAGVVGAVLAAAAMACGFWWIYFAYIPRIFEHVLESASGMQRGRHARDIGSFTHFLLVVALLMFAVVAKHLVEHPLDPQTLADRWLTFGAVALFNLGLLVAQWVIRHNISRERLTIISIAAAWMIVSADLPALVVVSVMAAFLIAAATVLWRRVRRNMSHVVA